MLTSLGGSKGTKISISDSQKELVAVKHWSLCDRGGLSREKSGSDLSRINPQHLVGSSSSCRQNMRTRREFGGG